MEEDTNKSRIVREIVPGESIAIQVVAIQAIE